MKKSLLALVLISLFTINSCQAQKKIMRTIEDAPILVEQKSKFINEPLNKLLNEIEPKFITVFGDPNGGTTGTYLLFYFVDRKQYNDMIKKGEKPIGISVDFFPEDNPQRKPIPKEGITNWGDEDVNAYGDMKVAKIRIVGGKN